MEALAGSLGLLSIALALISLPGARVAINEWGLWSSIPPAYILGLVGLSIAFVVVLQRAPGARLLLLTLCIAFAILLALPAAWLEGVARGYNGWFYYGQTDSLVRLGRLDSTIPISSSWPGLAGASAATILLAGIKGPELLLLFPLFYRIMLVLFGWFLFNRLLTDSRKVWGATWLLVGANWLDLDVFGAQAAGFLLYLPILALVVSRLREGGPALSPRSVVLGVLVTVLVVTHVGTTIFLFSAVLLLALFGHGLPTRASLRQGWLRRLALPGAVAGLFFAWLLTGAFGEFSSRIDGLIRGLLNPSSFSSRWVPTGTAAFAAGDSVRVFTVLLLGGVALTGLVLWWRRSVTDRERRSGRLFLVLGIAAIVPILFLTYGGEIRQRLLLFSLIPTVGLGILVWSKPWGRVLLIGILLLLPSLHLVAHYAHEDVYYVSNPELGGVRTYGEMADGGCLLSSSASLSTLVRLDTTLLTVRSEWSTDSPSSWDLSPCRESYVWFNRGSRAFADTKAPLNSLGANTPTFFRSLEARLAGETAAVHWYANPDFDAWLLGGGQ